MNHCKVNINLSRYKNLRNVIVEFAFYKSGKKNIMDNPEMVSP